MGFGWVGLLSAMKNGPLSRRTMSRLESDLDLLAHSDQPRRTHGPATHVHAHGHGLNGGGGKIHCEKYTTGVRRPVARIGCGSMSGPVAFRDYEVPGLNGESLAWRHGLTGQYVMRRRAAVLHIRGCGGVIEQIRHRMALGIDTAFYAHRAMRRLRIKRNAALLQCVLHHGLLEP